MADNLNIRPYKDSNKQNIRKLFIRINRLIVTGGMELQFGDYITRSLAEEIDSIPEYYEHHHSSFWIGEQNGILKCMFGLEKWGDDGMGENRQMILSLPLQPIHGRSIP
jgi:hypothetical protein